MVKRFLRDMAQGDKLPRNLPIRAADVPKGRLRLVGKAVRATAQEVRCKSARAQRGDARGGMHAGETSDQDAIIAPGCGDRLRVGCCDLTT